MYSTKIFIKYYLQNNHWLGHSVVEPVGVVAFQKIKTMREGKMMKEKSWKKNLEEKL